MDSLYLLLGLLGGVILLGALAYGARRAVEHRRRRVARLKGLYHRALISLCTGRTGSGFPLLHRAGARLALARALAELRETVVECDPLLMRRVVRDYELEPLLWRRLALPWAREEALRLLALIPVGRQTAHHLARCRYRRRVWRFYLLLARINASPAEALTLLRGFEGRFTEFESRVLLTEIIGGRLVVGCRDLLEAPEESLQQLGLRVVNHFGLPVTYKTQPRWS